MSTPSSVGETGERALIELIRARVPAAPPWVALGIGDDAAVVDPERGTQDVLTTDALVDGVHFDRRFTPPGAIGHRALAANLSDLAAMGAKPRVALLSLLLPADLPVPDFTGIIDGVLALAAAHQVNLVGGNITRTPGPLTIDVTAVGSVRRRRVLTRAGARPGDDVWVSGRVGAAAAGLASLTARGTGPAEPAMQACEAAYLQPEPRVRLGMLLGRNRAASACVDLSDGLADGLHQLAGASHAGIAVDASAIPVPDEAREWFVRHGREPLTAALQGGDDYELLFTVGARMRGRFRGVLRHAGDVTLRRIGVVTKDEAVTVKTPAGDRPVPAGYEHFR